MAAPPLQHSDIMEAEFSNPRSYFIRAQIIPGFTRPASWATLSGMSTITAILEADADGTLHLPVPQSLRRGKVKAVATLESEQEKNDRPTRETALAALRELRKLGTFEEIIDPVAWQREIRTPALPGRTLPPTG